MPDDSSVKCNYGVIISHVIAINAAFSSIFYLFISFGLQIFKRKKYTINLKKGSKSFLLIKDQFKRFILVKCLVIKV